MKKICAWLSSVRTFISLLVFVLDKDVNEIIKRDMHVQAYQCKYKDTHSISFLNYLLIFDKPFRSLFYFRIKKHKICWMLSRILLEDKCGVEIYGNIQGGCRIFHGQGTIIVCNSAGENLSVWQGVTVGRNPSTERNGIDTPTIGDNVNIYTGAIVAGNITIGDNVNIGAGSVVLKSIPANCTVIGNPARIIIQDGVSCSRPL